jgi:hypothetical protein
MLGPINPPPKLNTFGRMISRQVVVGVDATVTVFDVDLDDDTAWTIGYQEQDIGIGSGIITYRRNLVDLKQEISYGRNGGDFVTGVGAFRFEITGGPVGSTVNCFWTLQPYVFDCGSLRDTRSYPSGAGFSRLGSFDGYIPFPYNAVSIFAGGSPFTFRMQDGAGLIIQSAMLITPPDPYVLDFRPPPDIELRVSQLTGVNMDITAVYSRIP